MWRDRHRRQGSCGQNWVKAFSLGPMQLLTEDYRHSKGSGPAILGLPDNLPRGLVVP
jgi:hypothetical protein